jgi:hypothetical protein
VLREHWPPLVRGMAVALPMLLSKSSG